MCKNLEIILIKDEVYVYKHFGSNSIVHELTLQGSIW